MKSIMNYLKLLAASIVLLAQNAVAQTQQPALEAHVNTAVKSLSSKNFELWKGLFPDREKTTMLYDNFKDPEWKTPESDPYLRRLEEEEQFKKVERFAIRSFLKATVSGTRMDSDNMEPVAAYSWADMQVEKMRFDSVQKETESSTAAEWSGYVLFKNKKNNKSYVLRFTDVLKFEGEFWGIEFHDIEELEGKTFEEYLQHENSDAPTASTDEAVTVAIDSTASVPAYAATVAETETEYAGTVGSRKITIYWTEKETEDGSRTEAAYVYAGDPTYTYFGLEDLQNHTYSLTEPDNAAYWHIRRVKNSITGVRVLSDGSTTEKVLLKLKSGGEKQVYQKQKGE